MKRSILFCLLLCQNSFLFAQHWIISEGNPMPEPVGNNAVCEGFVNGIPYVYSFAGIDSTKNAAGIHLRSYRYNTSTEIWETIPSLPDDMGKVAASANRVGDIIYIIGGYYVFSNGTEVSSNKVHRYDTQSNTFLSDGSPIPIPIDDQVQVVYRDSLIYVVSGWSDNGNVNDVQIYDPANDNWQFGTPITWMQEASFGSAGTILGDTIYYYGGAKNGSFAPSRLLRKGAINPSDHTQITWSAEFLSSVFGGYRPAATTAGNEIYFIGGSDNTYNYDGIAYNNGQGVNPNNRSLLYRPTEGTFEGDESNDLPMDLRGIANLSDSIKYLTGGMLAGQNVSDKVWRLKWNSTITSARNPLVESVSISISPNPATSFLQIELPSEMTCNNLSIRLFNSLGNGVQYSRSSSCDLELNIQDLPNGIYFVEVSDGEKTGFGKFLKN